jgi:hypothetical protein
MTAILIAEPVPVSFDRIMQITPEAFVRRSPQGPRAFARHNDARKEFSNWSQGDFPAALEERARKIPRPMSGC